MGIFKDELNGKIMIEFSCLKPKMYSHLNLLIIIQLKMIINTKVVKKFVDIYHNDYKKCLYNEEILYKEFYNL